MPLDASPTQPTTPPHSPLGESSNGHVSSPALHPHSHTETSSTSPTRSRSRMRSVVRLILLMLVAVAAGAGWYYREQLRPLIAKVWPKEATPGSPPVRVVPVNAAPAVKRDMKLYLNGLGTVTPLKTVTIRSRVEGELKKVHFTEGQLVNEGDLLAEIDPRPFETQRDQAAGQLARDEATLKTAQITLERLQFLSKSEAVSAQDVDNQIAIVQQTEGILQTDRAMVANAELQLTYCKITSPITGVIGLRLVDIGNIVRANDPNGLAVVNQVQPIALVFTISQDDIPRVQKRMRETRELEVDSYNRDFTLKLASGRLLATDNQVDSTTGTLRLKAIFEKNEGTLFPNQFVNTRMLVEVKKDAIVVPSSAVQRGPSATYVYVLQADETVELRNVEVGPTEGAETAIEKGLSEGELVVTDGLDKLQPKAKVSLRDSEDKPAKEAPISKEEKPQSPLPGGSSAS
jgi:membrane fusion protein, multidrug efflux system